METLRTAGIWAGVLLFVITYGMLIRGAFKRDVVWGIFALFGPPLGGWAHAVTDWFFHGRILILNAVGVTLAAVFALWFPRPKVHGHWLDETGTLVLRFDEDGRLRNYDLQPDGRFVFRGFKIGTAELSVKSQTRLKIEGVPGVHVGYLRPREDVIDLYNELNDPEIMLVPDSPATRTRLMRVPEPLTADFRQSLAWLEQREAVQAAALRLLPKPDQASAMAPPVSAGMLQRYQQRIDAARTLPRTGLERLPLAEQIEVLRFRVAHAESLRAQTSADALLSLDLQADYFKLTPLRGSALSSVEVGRDLKRGIVVVRRALGFHEYEYHEFIARRATNGAWGFDLDLRHTEPMQDYPPASEKESSLERAVRYLQDELDLEVPSTAFEPPAEA